MIAFIHHVNQPFLNSPNHPITIPSELQYSLRGDPDFGGTGKAGSSVVASIILPDGRQLDGSVYYGEAGGRFFYQIRIKENNTMAIRKHFKSEPVIQVVMLRVAGQNNIYLLDQKNQQRVAPFISYKGPEAESRIAEELAKITDSTRPGFNHLGRF